MDFDEISNYLDFTGDSDSEEMELQDIFEGPDGTLYAMFTSDYPEDSDEVDASFFKLEQIEDMDEIKNVANIYEEYSENVV